MAVRRGRFNTFVLNLGKLVKGVGIRTELNAAIGALGFAVVLVVFRAASFVSSSGDYDLVSINGELVVEPI